MNTKTCEWRCCRKEFIPNRSFQKFCRKVCKDAFGVAAKRLRNKKKAVEYLGGKCSKCSYNKSLRALSFHHSNGETKDSTLANLISNNKGWNVVRQELDKCELLCANCHMEEHDINL